MLIQAAEDPPAQGQPSQSEELNRQTVPAEGHRHMVEGEGQTAQPQSRPAGQIPAQQQKAEPPEEELLEQGVHKGDVEGDPEEIFPAHSGAGSEGGGEAGEIEDAPGEKEAAENDSEYAGADAGSPVLYELVLAKRMPHAVDLRQLELAWAFLKKFSRQKDGSLKISE